LVSRPYVEITLNLMRRFGVDVERDRWSRFIVPAHSRYVSPGTIVVEGDASSASYFLAAGAVAGGPVRVIGVGTTSIQGDTRFAAMATELSKLGAVVDQGPDWLRIVPPAKLRAATIDTYDDHRMAMSFSLAALGGVAIRINDPQCVSKTFPDYFAAFAKLAA